MAWQQITFDQYGGSGGQTATLYVNYDTVTAGSVYTINYWATQQSTSASYRVTTVTPPTKSGKGFVGYGTSTTGGVRLAQFNGQLMTGSVSVSGMPATVYAQWLDGFVISLDHNGGTSYTPYVYYKPGVGCYSDEAMTNPLTAVQMPWAARPFCGYYHNLHQLIDASGRITPHFLATTFTGNATITARWARVGGMVDYFGYGSTSMKMLASTNGESKPHIVAAHYGKRESGVEAVGSGPWRNPEVTYMVVGDVSLDITLGTAFTLAGGSGYMITKVEIDTKLGAYPTIKVSATANEGANAINAFRLQVMVSARPRPANLLNAISGAGGRLTSCKLEAQCTPVVCEENCMPCASDVVDGKITVKGSAYDPDGQITLAAGAGFTSLGEPDERNDGAYTTKSITVEKGM